MTNDRSSSLQSMHLMLDAAIRSCPSRLSGAEELSRCLFYEASPSFSGWQGAVQVAVLAGMEALDEQATLSDRLAVLVLSSVLGGVLSDAQADAIESAIDDVVQLRKSALASLLESPVDHEAQGDGWKLNEQDVQDSVQSFSDWLRGLEVGSDELKRFFHASADNLAILSEILGRVLPKPDRGPDQDGHLWGRCFMHLLDEAPFLLSGWEHSADSAVGARARIECMKCQTELLDILAKRCNARMIAPLAGVSRFSSQVHEKVSAHIPVKPDDPGVIARLRKHGWQISGTVQKAEVEVFDAFPGRAPIDERPLT